jgi:hypothetical protein
MRRIAAGPRTFAASEVGATGKSSPLGSTSVRPAFAEIAERIDQRFRSFDQHAFDELAERAFHGVFPTGFDLQLFADARGAVQAARLEPCSGGALLLAQRRVLQRFERREATARGLCGLAHLGQFALRAALLVLHGRDGGLAFFDLRGEPVERGLLRVVLHLQAGEGLRQRGEVQAGAFAGELFAAAFGVERLAVELFDARAFDIAGARGLGLRAGVRVPALLPVGERGVGVAQGVLARGVFGAQAFEFGFGRGDRLAQRIQARLVAADVRTQFAQRALRFVAGALQALRHFALVRDLLLDARQRAAHLVDLRLRLVQRLAGFLAAHAVGFDLALGFALLGDELLQAGFFVVELFLQRLHACVEAAEFQRLPLGVLDAALGLDRLVLLGLAGLAAQVFELLADFLAQVVEAVRGFRACGGCAFRFPCGAPCTWRCRRLLPGTRAGLPGALR